MINILIIDDELNNSRIMESLLTSLSKYFNEKKLKFNFDKCDDISEAIENIKNNNYKFIILDIMLPYLDVFSFKQSVGGLITGKIFFNNLRNNKYGKNNKDIPVIIYTNYKSKKEKKEIEEKYDNVYYIFKPFKKDVLKNIDKILG